LSRRFLRGDRSTSLDALFGSLERRVLEALWRRAEEASVRDLEPDFPDTAYTTLMTTLDRLHKKGVLDRSKTGRAYRYAHRFTREGLESYLAADAFDALLGGTRSPASARPLLTSFVDAVSRRDALLLDELERLVREKRREAGDELELEGDDEC
jgi:predicted transcriptional regulator